MRPGKTREGAGGDLVDALHAYEQASTDEADAGAAHDVMKARSAETFQWDGERRRR